MRKNRRKSSLITVVFAAALITAGCVFPEEGGDNSGSGSGSGGGGGALTITETDEGTLLRGGTLTGKLDWLNRNAQSHGVYIIELSSNQNIAPRTLSYPGAINITVMLRGSETNRTVRLSTNGIMFTVNANVTFILDNNITLQGHSHNTGVVVRVNGGTFVMNEGTTISGNSHTGVHLVSGTFEMTGGTISGNTAGGSQGRGGGVFVGNYFGHDPSTFNMTGGTITGNNARSGGGVSVLGHFSITDGIISNNNASEQGGGLFVVNTFGSTMFGGTISSNTASWGGGVSVNGGFVGPGAFAIRGGTVTGNTATANGGGIFVGERGTLDKTGGTITGYGSDPDNGNVVRDVEGVLARRGHAVWVNETRRRETTAGPEVNLSSRSNEGWDP